MDMTKTRFIIARTAAATGRKLYLTESRTAGVSFEAPGNTVTGVGVANLKTWGTEAGAHRWLKARPDMLRAYAAAGMTVSIEPATPVKVGYRHGPARFEGHDAEGLAIYSNVVLSPVSHHFNGEGV